MLQATCSSLVVPVPVLVASVGGGLLCHLCKWDEGGELGGWLCGVHGPKGIKRALREEGWLMGSKEEGS